MICTKEDLKRYLDCDKKALGIKRNSPKLIGDRIWKYERLYRKTEYYFNNKEKNIVYKILYYLHYVLFKYKSERWGNEFPMNCIEEGLVIWHGQNIIINPNAKIGKNFSISTGCIVGQAHNQFPIIGDNVEMTVDSKVLGGITITDNVTIGAGAVVIKSIDIPYTSWGGIPAHCLSKKSRS